MKRVGIPVQAAAVSAIVALVALAIYRTGAIGFDLGLVIGAINAAAVERSLDTPIGFRAASMGRLVIITALAFGVALVFGQQAQLPGFLLGIAVAQLALVGVAAWSVSRR